VRERANELLVELARGDLQLDVTTFALAEAPDAYRALREARVRGKVALLP